MLSVQARGPRCRVIAGKLLADFCWPSLRVSTTSAGESRGYARGFVVDVVGGRLAHGVDLPGAPTLCV